MENVMNNGFVELSNEDMMTVEGGGFWSKLVGATCIGLGLVTCNPMFIENGVIIWTGQY